MIERSFIKEKIADLTVQLAKRAWPQLWPDMIPALMQLVAAGVRFSTINIDARFSPVLSA